MYFMHANRKIDQSKGYTGFLSHYRTLDPNRFEELFQSLMNPPCLTTFYNPFTNHLKKEGTEALHPLLSGCTHSLSPATPYLHEEGVLSHYNLDAASILVAKCLPIGPNDRVLDMCAAPGGKALIIASKLLPLGGYLIANERSFNRRLRLKQVLSSYIPSTLQKNFSITGFDAAQIGLYQKETFDAILLDAPCSSERHLLTQPKLLHTWSPKRSAQLAIRQYAMLASALLCLKPGGFVLYATCSLSPLENDQVIERLLRKKKDQIKQIPCLPEWAEKTPYGAQIWPDRAFGAGPLFFSLLQKR